MTDRIRKQVRKLELQRKEWAAEQSTSESAAMKNIATTMLADIDDRLRMAKELLKQETTQ